MSGDGSAYDRRLFLQATDGSGLIQKMDDTILAQYVDTGTVSDPDSNPRECASCDGCYLVQIGTFGLADAPCHYAFQRYRMKACQGTTFYVPIRLKNIGTGSYDENTTVAFTLNDTGGWTLLYTGTNLFVLINVVALTSSDDECTSVGYCMPFFDSDHPDTINYGTYPWGDALIVAGGTNVNCGTVASITPTAAGPIVDDTMGVGPEPDDGRGVYRDKCWSTSQGTDDYWKPSFDGSEPTSVTADDQIDFTFDEGSDALGQQFTGATGYTPVAGPGGFNAGIRGDVADGALSDFTSVSHVSGTTWKVNKFRAKRTGTWEIWLQEAFSQIRVYAPNPIDVIPGVPVSCGIGQPSDNFGLNIRAVSGAPVQWIKNQPTRATGHVDSYKPVGGGGPYPQNFQLADTVKIYAYDQWNNHCKYYTGGSVSIDVEAYGGLVGVGTPMLTGTLTKSFVNGVATFDDLGLFGAGKQYRFKITPGGGLTVRPPITNVLITDSWFKIIDFPAQVKAGVLFKFKLALVSLDGTPIVPDVHTSNVTVSDHPGYSGSFAPTAASVAPVAGVATFEGSFPTAGRFALRMQNDDPTYYTLAFQNTIYTRLIEVLP